LILDRLNYNSGVNIPFYSQIFHLGKVSLFREFRGEFHGSGLRVLFCREFAIQKGKPFPIKENLS
jgi:hypothetical protein